MYNTTISSLSPTARTLALLRSRGSLAQVTEHWNPFAHIRQDLLGFGDVLSVGADGITLVQCTSASNHSARRKKITALPAARRWLEAGGRILLVSWGKKKVKNRSRWVPKCEEIGLKMINKTIS